MNKNINRIYYELRKFLRKQTLKKWKSLEYDNPNYWEIAWVNYFLKKAKVFDSQDREYLFRKLNLPYL